MASNISMREEIEDEIVLYAQRIVNLKTRLNTLAPISVLPPEILSEVFLHRASVIGNEEPHGSLPYDWIGVSHICRHWRAVALDCPTLWSRLTLPSRQDWIAELLSRSKEAPLDVSVSLTTGHWNRSVNDAKEKSFVMALAHLTRIRALHIHAPYGLSQEVLGRLCSPAPMLRALVTKGPIIRSKPSANGPSTLPRLSNHIQTDSLQLLKVIDCPVDWSSSTGRSLATLTHLTIEENSYHTRSMNVHALVAALQQMTLLEELTVYVTFSRREPPALDPSMQAVLPRLRILQLTSDCKDIVDFLRQSETPSLSKLTIRAHGDIQISLEAFVSVLSAKVSRLGPFLTLMIDGPSAVPGLRLYPELVNSMALDKVAENPKPKSPTFTLHMSPRYSESIITALCERLPVGTVRSMQVSGWSLSQKTWLKIMERTKKIEELQLIGTDGTEALPQALLHRRRSRKREEGSDRAYSYPLPRLRCLAFDLVRFADAETANDEGISDFLECLRDCFMERYEYGAEIERLLMSRCTNLHGIDVDLLEEVVRYVEWDGFVDIESPDDWGSGNEVEYDDDEGEEDEGSEDYLDEDMEEMYNHYGGLWF